MAHGFCTDGMEAVDDPPTNILSKPITEPGADPGGGGGIGSGAPPAISMGAMVGAVGFYCKLGSGHRDVHHISLCLWSNSPHC